MKQVEVNIRFVYDLNEPGPISGNVIRTREDAENEVQKELEEIDPSEFVLTSKYLD